jgi:hypothetical protein
LFAFALSLVSATADSTPFHGYIVTGQWDGRTWPVVEWALDITRQDVEWRPHQELKYINLIPTTRGNALSPTLTAFEPKSRSYFLTVERNHTAASLWGVVLSGDTNTTTRTYAEVRYHYPVMDDSLKGLEAWNNQGTVQVLAIFGDCNIMQIDYTTGHDSLWATICNSTDRQVTGAIELNQDTNTLYIITQSPNTAQPARELVTIDLASKRVTSVALQPLKNHDANQETPFEACWFPSLNALLVFYTGKFDQMVFVTPDGNTEFGVFDLAEYTGSEGYYEFTADDFLEDDDMWSDCILDPRTGFIYFQCTVVDQVSQEPSIGLCQSEVPKKIGPLEYIDVAIWPLTYGYAGLQWVPIVA